MQISQVISDFAGAIDAVRDKLSKSTAEIDAVKGKRHAVVNAAPHTDDIVAVFMRGLLNEVESFRHQLGTHLANTYAGDGSAAKVEAGRAATLLRLDASPPPKDFTQRREGPAPLNLSVLAFLLRERIEAEIPALVHTLCPAARDGMKAADRAAALKEIDGELARLDAEREALLADLAAARAAVMPQG